MPMLVKRRPFMVLCRLGYRTKSQQTLFWPCVAEALYWCCIWAKLREQTVSWCIVMIQFQCLSFHIYGSVSRITFLPANNKLFIKYGYKYFRNKCTNTTKTKSCNRTRPARDIKKSRYFLIKPSTFNW